MTLFVKSNFYFIQIKNTFNISFMQELIFELPDIRIVFYIRFSRKNT